MHDCCIVGGGVIGLSIAWELARRGRVDQRAAGHRDLHVSLKLLFLFFQLFRPLLDLFSKTNFHQMAPLHARVRPAGPLPPHRHQGRRRLDPRPARARPGKGRGQGREAAVAVGGIGEARSSGGGGDDGGEADIGGFSHVLRRRCGVPQGRHSSEKVLI